MSFKYRKTLTRITRLDEEELANLKKRNDIVAIIIISFIALLIARLWYLQINNGAKYASLAENNRVRVQDIVAPRGNILDRQGRVLVSNRPTFNIVWTKEDAPQPDQVIKRLAKILNEDTSVLLERIRAAADNPRHIPIRLKDDIDWKTLAYIENNHVDLPGVSIEALPMRDYRFSSLASHVIGYLGEINQKELAQKELDAAGGEYQQGDQIGKMGVEKLFEPFLRGEKGRHYMEVNAQGFEQRRLKGRESLPGKDIYLTIDLDLQAVAEQGMAGKAGSVVVLEVNTGRVLTLASTPNLELKNFVGGISAADWQELLDDPLSPLYNKAIMGQYPPGSTYKMIPAVAALSEKIINPETVFYCSGSITFGNRKYGCWKQGGHGAVNLHRALAESCDVYFYQVGQRLGVDMLARYASSFGLGEKTGIELEHEKAGLVPTAEWKRQKKNVAWQKGETMSVAIGQGFNLATPLQITRMMAAMVNGGILYQPQLIDQIKSPDNMVIDSFTPRVTGKVLGSEQYMDLIGKALVAAVNDPHGTGRDARPAKIVVGGKTGTAQVVRLKQYEDVKDEDIPYKYRDHAWFVCFAPADKPEIAVGVLVEHGGHGGAVAGPIARQVLEKYFEGRSKNAELQIKD